MRLPLRAKGQKSPLKRPPKAPGKSPLDLGRIGGSGAGRMGGNSETQPTDLPGVQYPSPPPGIQRPRVPVASRPPAPNEDESRGRVVGKRQAVSRGSTWSGGIENWSLSRSVMQVEEAPFW